MNLSHITIMNVTRPAKIIPVYIPWGATHYESVPVRWSRASKPAFLQGQRVLLAAVVGY